MLQTTTLKMNLVLEILRGQKEGQVWGSSKKSIDRHRGSRALPPLETWLRFHQNSYTPSFLLTGSVFSNSREKFLLWLFRQRHNLFLNTSVLSYWQDSSETGSFLADRSGANTKQLSISHGGQQFMVSPAGNGSGLNLTIYPTIGSSCLVQGKIILIPFEGSNKV